jgi:hypothetical protein
MLQHTAVYGEFATSLLDDILASQPRGTTAIDGLGRADAALARYRAEFDDPTWKPLQSVE